MNVWVQEGKVQKVQGLPEDPRTGGRLCPKGMAAADILYAPDRLLTPLRRIGERGEGKWAPISWDEALDQITTKFREIIDQDGPQAIGVYRGQASDHGASWLYALRFMNALGAPNLLSPCHLCYVPRMTAHLLTYGGMVEPDWENTRCLIIWGANPTQTSERAPFGWQIKAAKARGAKLIVVDPIRTELADGADIWAALRPGTDCALALGMLHAIVAEGLYDREFVRDWTKGFEALERHLQNYDLTRVAGITGVPAETIREMAQIYSRSKHAAIFEGNGLDQHINVVQSVRALCLLRAVTGNLEVKGGEGFPDTLSAKARDIKLLDRLPVATAPVQGRDLYFDLTRSVPPPPLIDAVLTGKPYSIRALLVQGGNPLITFANTKKTEEAFRKIEFLAVMDLFMSRTARLADLVLPAATFLETTGLTAYPGMRTNSPILQQKVVEPLGESRPDWKLWFELAKRMGLEADFPWQDVDEAIDYQLEPIGLSARHLKGFLVLIPKRYDKFKERGFLTPSKKVELYSDVLAERGFDPLPNYVDPSDYFPHYAQVREQFPLIGTNYPRTNLYIHSQFRNIPALRRRDPEPLVYLHPDDAATAQLGEGDMALVESPTGRVTVRASLTDRIPPHVIGITWGWGEAVPEAGTNELTPDLPRDAICGATSNRLFFCRIACATKH
jgi:anaerobic selenocysteine-containing dehydrogenase